LRNACVTCSTDIGDGAFAMSAVMNRASIILLTCLGWVGGCDLNAPVVKLPAEGGTAGSAGQGVTAGGTSATGGSVNPADPYGESRYDWCLPPAYDPMLAPSEECGIPFTDSNSLNLTVTILLDRSLSMQKPLPGSSTSKWIGVRNALSRLAAEQPGFLDQWSLMAFARTDTFAADENCIEGSYQAFAPTRQVDQPKLDVKAILEQFDSLQPTALIRPTAAALYDAIADAQHNALSFNGTSMAAVVLITDGPPYGCASATEMDDLIEVARNANVATVENETQIHVIQLGDGYDLSPVAQTGEKNRHYLVSGGDVGRQLVKIIRRIIYPGPSNCARWMGVPRKSVNGARSVDFTVIMESEYTHSELAPPHLASAADCDTSPAGGFWVADTGTDEPYMIGFCPCTCAAVGTDSYTIVKMYCRK
jgi:hypothetical protein